MSEESSTPKRRRGAPLGNRNAWKHGFYSRLFRKDDLSDLEDIDVTDREQEINALRVIIRLVLEKVAADGTPKELIDALFAISHAFSTMNRLIKSYQDDLNDSSNKALSQAINEVLAELESEDDSGPSPAHNSSLN